MNKNRRSSNESISDFEPSDSDDDYNENEKLLLQNVRNKRSTYSDSEEEVFGVGNESDEESDQSDIALSDVEGQDDDDDLPDARAWGKDKRKFYSTDYVDQDYGGFQGKDAHFAELEEEEARKLQQQLIEQLDDDDFSLDLLSTEKNDEDKKQLEEVVKTDFSKLSKRQKLDILHKESPEFFGLVEDFGVKMEVAKDHLNPVLKKYKKGQIPKCAAMEFVETQYELILNYCTNIYMYLLLKASRVNLGNHPVIKRLYQYRQLLSQVFPIYEDTIKPQIELLLEDNGGVVENQGIKKLAVLKKLTGQPNKVKKNRKSTNDNEQPTKKVRFNDDVEIEPVKEDLETDEDEINKVNELENNTDVNEIEKRAITYQIAKNKGLTPYRKKENRNPRIKHRNKFRKAKIRRKGAIREPRKEMSRYGGEISGIKTTVTKSIKIKT